MKTGLLFLYTISILEMAPEKCALEQSDGVLLWKIMGEEGRAGREPDGSGGWHSVGPSPLDVWVSPPTQQRPHGMWIWYCRFSLEPQQFHEAGKPMKRLLCADTSWRLELLWSPGRADVTWPLPGHDSHQPAVLRLQKKGSQSGMSQNLGIGPGAAQWRSMPL